MMKKMLAVLLSALMLFGTVMPAYADEALTENAEATETVTGTVAEETTEETASGEKTGTEEAEEQTGSEEQTEEKTEEKSSSFIVNGDSGEEEPETEEETSVKQTASTTENTQKAEAAGEEEEEEQPHTHTLGTVIEENPAACYTVYICGGCGKKLVRFSHVYDENGKCTVCGAAKPFETEAEKACEHDYEFTSEIQPGCETAGSITSTCSLCGKVRVDTLSALGHDYEDGVCTRCGASDPDSEQETEENGTAKETASTEGEQTTGENNTTEGEQTTGENTSTEGEQTAGENNATEGEQTAGENNTTEGEQTAGEELPAGLTVPVTGAADSDDVTLVALTITAKSATKPYDGTALTAEGYESAVGLLDSDTLTVVVSGSQTDAGESANKITTYTITRGTEDVTGEYTVETEDGKLTVTALPITVSVTGEKVDVTYDGKEHTATDVTFESESEFFDEGKVTYATKSKTGTDYTPLTNIGYAATDFTYGDTNLSVTFDVTDGFLQIAQAPYYVVTEGASKKYDGSPLTNPNAHIEGLVNGETATVTASGTITDPGSASNTYQESDINWGTASSGNYHHDGAKDVYGSLVVYEEGALAVTITGFDVTYDGEWHQAESDLEGDLPTGYTYSITLENDTLMNVGTDIASVQEVHIYDADGNDVTSEYTIDTSAQEYIEVSPKHYGIRTASASKTYNGYPLSVSTASVIGLVKNETATVAAVSSRTDAGTEDNLPGEITWGTADKDNYEHDDDLDDIGTLTVTTRKLTLVSASGSKKYDGTLLTKDTSSDFSVTGLASTDQISVTIDGSRLHVGSSPNTFTYTFTKGSAENYTISEVCGTLTVTKRYVTLTSPSAEKKYNGYPLTEEVVKIGGNGFASGEGVYYEVTGSQTKVGKSKNTFIYWMWDNTLPTDYNITCSYGTLRVYGGSTTTGVDDYWPYYFGGAAVLLGGIVAIVIILAKKKKHER